MAAEMTTWTRKARAAFGALLLGLGLAACATSAPAPSGESGAPSRDLIAPNFVRAKPEAVDRRFDEAVARRFALGGPMPAAVTDLQTNGFRCQRSRHTLGVPPARACRRTVEQAGCRHTWQVFLYATSQPAPNLTRVRSVYDRACDADPLLGGPKA